MKIQKEYIIVVNGRPYFSVLNEDLIPGIEDEAVARFGAEVEVKVFVQTTELYAPGKDNGN